jgi:hypothetical protein
MIRILVILLFIIPFSKKTGISNNEKIVIYSIPIKNVMYYSSVTEERLKNMDNLKKYVIKNNELLTEFKNLLYKTIERDSCLKKHFSLDLRVIIEIYSNDILLNKIYLDKCGLYKYNDKIFMRNNKIVSFLETNIANIEFEKCNFYLIKDTPTPASVPQDTCGNNSKDK